MKTKLRTLHNFAFHLLNVSARHQRRLLRCLTTRRSTPEGETDEEYLIAGSQIVCARTTDWGLRARTTDWDSAEALGADRSFRWMKAQTLTGIDCEQGRYLCGEGKQLTMKRSIDIRGYP